MLLIEFMQENDIFETKKGRGAFIIAMRQTFPNIFADTMDDNSVYGYGMLMDMEEEDIARFLKLWGKSTKLYIFS